MSGDLCPYADAGAGGMPCPYEFAMYIRVALKRRFASFGAGAPVIED